MERKVVITGYGVINALGNNKEEVYKNIFSGKSGIVKKDVESLTGSVLGSIGWVNLKGQDDFFQENDLPYERCSDLALRAASECILGSGIDKRDLSKYRKGICVGTILGGILSGDIFLRQWIKDGAEKVEAKYLKQYPLHAIADVLAKKFGFCGVKSVISTACAAGANAIGFGYDMIRSGKYDIMLVGGIDPFTPFTFSGFRSLKSLDPEPCKPYSASKGINLGEGAAFFILEDYEGAVDRNAKILGEVLSYGLSADAYHQTAPAIGGSGAIQAVELAIKMGGITKDDISYINGHGTGTPANDSMEELVYNKLFKDFYDKIPMSSIKGGIGHCLGAAGAVECAASLMAIVNNKVPPTVNFNEPEKNAINHVPNKAQDHECKVVLSDSFAFGGNNCCVALGKPNLGFKSARYEKKSIVITGIGCNGVGGADIKQLFETFDNQTIQISEINDFDSTPYKCKKQGMLSKTDYKKYIPSKILRRIDSVAKLAITSGKQALTDSGIHVTQANANRIGVIYATSTGPLDTIESISRSIISEGIDGVNPSDFPNSVYNGAPGNFCISNMLKGPTSTVSCGMASSMVAFIYACELINSGQADVLVVISADINNETMHLGYEKMGLLSDNDISPLCEGADGMVLSQGSVAFIIESEEHAKMRNAKTYASVKGYSSTSDNEALNTVHITGDEYAQCLKNAINESKVNEIDLFVSGALGKKEVDQCEINAINQLFNKSVHLSNPQAMLGSTTGSVGFYGMLCAFYSFQKNKILSMPENAEGQISRQLRLNYVKGKNVEKSIKTACIGSISYGGCYASIVLEKSEQNNIVVK